MRDQPCPIQARPTSFEVAIFKHWSPGGASDTWISATRSPLRGLEITLESIPGADAPGNIRSPLPGLKTRLTLEMRNFKTGASSLYSRHLVPLDCKMVLEDLHELC